ncbi:hypothetical protein ACIQVR_39320 [Streptomyces xanthochromogenes]|uniref:hypothetical protein n=1 Tax=Streptomyces xanthochromogenes TaxID=67384 RepID=UPI0037F56CF2
MENLLTTTDPEAAGFFADAKAALTRSLKPAPSNTEVTLPADWPITPGHDGDTLNRAELQARRGHALRISYDWVHGRQAMWVGRFRGGDWSILQGYVGKPASLLTSPHTWDASVRELTKLAAPDRMLGGGNPSVDAWLPEFVIICMVHGGACNQAEPGHHFVERRSLSRYPAGTYRPCGGAEADHDGCYSCRFQVDGRWRRRYSCRRHYAALLDRYLAEADGTVTVWNMDDHLDERIAQEVAA